MQVFPPIVYIPKVNLITILICMDSFRLHTYLEMAQIYERRNCRKMARLNLRSFSIITKKQSDQ